ASDLGVTPAPVLSIERIYAPEKSKQTQMLEGAAGEVAAKLVEKLKFEARVL
ncbi:MAG: electron transfer flavoprotein subunit beta, partial [Acidobacteria bacterium]|nr:electron transfer flavoprotein subunit beta [Acidobacteriota bacterium]